MRQFQKYHIHTLIKKAYTHPYTNSKGCWRFVHYTLFIIRILIMAQTKFLCSNLRCVYAIGSEGMVGRRGGGGEGVGEGKGWGEGWREGVEGRLRDSRLISAIEWLSLLTV